MKEIIKINKTNFEDHVGNMIKTLISINNNHTMKIIDQLRNRIIDLEKKLDIGKIKHINSNRK